MGQADAKHARPASAARGSMPPVHVSDRCGPRMRLSESAGLRGGSPGMKPVLELRVFVLCHS